MNAPWVADARHFAQLDAEAAADYARERLAAEIAADPHKLAVVLSNTPENDRRLLLLCEALSAVYAYGEQATPEQSLAVCLAVQSLADEAARYEIEI